jgi:glucose-6-phosphate 1-dehydrogenase
MDLEGFRAFARQTLEAHGGVDEAAFAKLAARLRYVNGDYNEPGTFQRIKEALGGASRPLFYLAIPPEVFAPSMRPATVGCNENARVVGKAVHAIPPSGLALNQSLKKLPETASSASTTISERTVQNLRISASPTFLEPSESAHVHAVEITMAEKLGSKGEAAFMI